MTAPASLLFVARGPVDLFAVENDGGRRHFLCRLDDGAWLPPPPVSSWWRVQAVPGLGARLEHADGPLPPAGRDGWIATLAEGLAAAGAPLPDLALRDGNHDVAAGTRVGGSGRLPIWVRVRDGRFTLAGQEIDATAPPQALTRTRWLTCVTPGTVDVLATLPEDEEQAALDGFHAQAGQIIDRALRDRAEQGAALRRQRAERDRQVHHQALATLAALPRAAEHADDALAAPAAPQAVPHLTALHVVARVLDLTVKAPVAGDDAADLLRATLKASGIRWRPVLLRDGWWRKDSGPFLAWFETDDERDGASALALLPSAKGKGYELHVPDGQVLAVDEDLAARLKPHARMLYRRLPDIGLDGWQLLRFGMRGNAGLTRRLAVLGALIAGLALSVPFATSLLVEQVIPRAMVNQHLILVGGLLAAALGGGSFQMVRALSTLSLQGRLDWALQAGLFDRLLRLPAAFFAGYSAGDLADRVLGIQAMREKLSGAALTALQGLAFSLFSLGALFFFNVKMAVAGLALAALSLAVTAFAARRQMRHEITQADSRGRVEGLVFQILSGIAKLKTAAALHRGFAAWARSFAGQKTAAARAARVGNRLAVFHAAFPPLATVALLALAAWLAKNQGMEIKLHALGGGDPAKAPKLLEAGAVMGFLAAFGQFLAALTAFGQSLGDILAAVPLYRRAQPVLAALPEETGLRRDPGPLQGGVEFANVSFGYAKGGPRLMENLSLSIAPGEWVAVVGPSGSGKSTLLRLLLGFERPDGGEIFLDGKPLADLDMAAVRRQIGVVLQNGRVTGGSVLSNIVGASGLGLDDAWAAARQVGLDRDIDAMPMGMHTPLLDGAGTLSGGQRQRLLLARAMIRRPRLLVLDEATSALDNRTQAMVTETLAALPVTRVVIAHRLTSVQRAGRIIVMRAGAVAQQGRYQDLIETPGPFADMARRQML